jgi:hypothetical protein
MGNDCHDMESEDVVRRRRVLRSKEGGRDREMEKQCTSIMFLF